MSMQNMSSHQRDFVGEICFFLSLFWQIVQGIGGIAQRFQKRSNRGEILNGSLNFFNQKAYNYNPRERGLYCVCSTQRIKNCFATPFFTSWFLCVFSEPERKAHASFFTYIVGEHIRIASYTEHNM